ncbi:MAG: hypothetical protein AAFW46_10690 [Pseudomonadota bacterium]
MRRLMIMLSALFALSACVQGEDFVRDAPATPFVEGLYRFCELDDPQECVPTYMFRDGEEYVYATRDGSAGKAFLSEIGPGLFLAFHEAAEDFYGYGAVRIDAAGAFSVRRFDCGAMQEAIGTDALAAQGLFFSDRASPLPHVSGSCRVESREAYAALAELARSRLDDLSEPDGKFLMTLIREDRFPD